MLTVVFDSKAVFISREPLSEGILLKKRGEAGAKTAPKTGVTVSVNTPWFLKKERIPTTTAGTLHHFSRTKVGFKFQKNNFLAILLSADVPHALRIVGKRFARGGSPSG